MGISKVLPLVIAATLLGAPSSGMAATVKWTEGKRTEMMSGESMRGHAAMRSNRDVRTYDTGLLAAPDMLMLAGRVARTGADAWTGTIASGDVFRFSIAGFAESARNGASPFSAIFTLMSGGNIVERVTLTGRDPSVLRHDFRADVTGAWSLGIQSRSGASDYDITGSSVPITAAPVPAAGVLMLGALAGFGLIRRRRKA